MKMFMVVTSILFQMSSPALAAPELTAPCINFSGLYEGTCINKNGAFSSVIKISQYAQDRGGLGDYPGAYCAWLDVATAPGNKPVDLLSVVHEFTSANHTNKSIETRMYYKASAPYIEETKVVTSSWNSAKTEFAIKYVFTDKVPHYNDTVTTSIKTFKITNGKLIVTTVRPDGGYGWDSSCEYTPIK